jgi:hypothetical protein
LLSWTLSPGCALHPNARTLKLVDGALEEVVICGGAPVEKELRFFW